MRPIEMKKVITNVIVSEHVTSEDVERMKRVAQAVAFHVEQAYMGDGFVVTVQSVPRKGEPLKQGNWDLEVSVLKDNSVRLEKV